MYSFLVTYRNRPQMLEDFKVHIHKFFPNSEIVVAEQKNDKLFMQGQLFNLAYPHSKGSIVVLMDVDMRFQKAVDLEGWMRKINRPFMGYNLIMNCDESGNPLGVRKNSNISHGGCCVFTRKQFEESCGFSNLMCGWGGEDDILHRRICGYQRIENTLLHIEHERNIEGGNYNGNVVLYKSDKLRNKALDGFRQTTGNLVDKKIDQNTTHLFFDSIGVVKDFAYKSLLRPEMQ